MKTLWSLIPLSICAAMAGCDSSGGDTRVVGQLESDRIEITAEFSEPIVEILVKEGQRVAAGDLLLQQDKRRILSRIRETEAALAQSKARLDELVRGPRKEQIAAGRANVQGATHDLEFRKADYERAQMVFQRDLASPDSLDRARAALDAAEANLQVQQARLQEMLSGTTIEELTQAQQAVRQIEARLSVLQVDLERHAPLAPVDGIVDSRLYEPGERPAVGKPMLILLSGEQPYARVYVPEILRVRLSPGTAARVYVDGLAEPLNGTVRWVSSEAAFTPYFSLTERDRGRLSYIAKVDILNADRRLPDGVPVEVELILDAGE
ncbi:MAG: HlyD family efflux transporter periplasmic adaptor subunit [Woeseiaceae bacterium]|nr:HlyD family efflux transporter periplasmic adaptor subunit [Woeseiaceae bacterium]